MNGRQTYACFTCSILSPSFCCCCFLFVCFCFGFFDRDYRENRCVCIRKKKTGSFYEHFGMCHTLHTNTYVRNTIHGYTIMNCPPKSIETNTLYVALGSLDWREKSGFKIICLYVYLLMYLCVYMCVCMCLHVCLCVYMYAMSCGDQSQGHACS